ncbi:MAG: hypothetical protein V1858_00570 [Candidatus Gottesmanbacteria bacterium]
MKKKITFLGIFLGLVILLFTVKPLIAPTIQRRIIPNTEKTYSNPKYGFEFKYPGDWQVEQWDIEEAANLKKVTDGTIIYQGRFFSPLADKGHFEVLIWQNKSKASVHQYLSWYRHEDLILKDLPAQENYYLAGLPAIIYLQKTTSKKKPILYIFFNKDDKLYELIEERQDLINAVATDSSQFVSPVYDKLLQSFKFIVR